MRMPIEDLYEEIASKIVAMKLSLKADSKTDKVDMLMVNIYCSMCMLYDTVDEKSFNELIEELMIAKASINDLKDKKEIMH